MPRGAWNQGVTDREEQRAQKRKAVLETAARLFRERGFERTSLEDIAGDLGVTKRTLYYYIQSKDDILFECNRLAIRFMDKALAESRHSLKSPLERIEAMMRTYIRLLSNDFGACLVLCKDDVLSDPLRAILREGRRDLDIALRRLIQQGIDDGSIASCEPRYAAAAVFGAFNWVPYWAGEHEPLSYAEIGEQLLAVVLDGLRARGAT